MLLFFDLDSSVCMKWEITVLFLIRLFNKEMSDNCIHTLFGYIFSKTLENIGEHIQVVETTIRHEFGLSQSTIHIFLYSFLFCLSTLNSKGI